MSAESPFTLKRFEYERRHLYYLPKQPFRTLEGRKSVYLIGSRGTGKTTLLNALHWREQLDNRELITALDAADAGRGYIGLYIKVPSTAASAFGKWMPNAAEDFRATLFCLYLDLVWIQSALEAVADLIIRKKLGVSPARERALTASILERYREFRAEMQVSKSPNVKELSTVFYEKRRMLERWCFSKSEPSREFIERVLPIGPVGEVGRCVAKEIDKCIRANGTDGDPNWHLKVCFDEAECLSEPQQRALNTMVRLLEAELSFVVSYVRAVDVTTTLLPHISLQDADRELIDLDNMSDEEFKQFAGGVATVRMHRVPEGALETSFDTVALLGRLDINGILMGILRASASPEAKRMLQAAEALARTQYYVNVTSGEGEAKKSLPIYEAYLIDQLSLQIPSPDSEQWEKRRQDSAEIRKRMVVAYLCICKDLNTEAKYASADMLFQMCDKCIRDYLNQMDSLFERVGKSPRDFCSTRIPVDQQHSALLAASMRKKDAIPSSEVGSPIETLRLIDALGKLTARLQTTSSLQRSLRSSELGHFVLDKRDNLEGAQAAVRLILEAAETGFLKILESTNGLLKFRMHCSLAPAYGFSYRGAYYPCSVKMSDVIGFYRNEDDDEREKQLSAVAQYILHEPLTLPLFKE